MNLRELIDRYFANEYRKRTPRGFWRVSKIGMPFDQYHERIGSPKDEADDYTISRHLLVAELGTACHKRFFEIIKEMSDNTESTEDEDRGTVFKYPIDILMSEQEIIDETHNLSGHPDLVLTFTDTNRKVLYDFKTVNEHAWSKMKQDGNGYISAYPHHIKQILIYDYILSNHYDIVVDEIRLWYWDRNTGRREEVVVQRDPAVMDEVFEEIRMLEECLKTNTPPPAPSKDSWQFKYSNYKNLMGYDLSSDK